MKEKMALYKLAPVLQILINKVKKKRESFTSKRNNTNSGILFIM